jgi:putative transcriptional regulator
MKDEDFEGLMAGVAEARLIGVSTATLRNWEQGRRQPEGPARVLLSMLARDPGIVTRVLSGVG